MMDNSKASTDCKSQAAENLRDWKCTFFRVTSFKDGGTYGEGVFGGKFGLDLNLTSRLGVCKKWEPGGLIFKNGFLDRTGGFAFLGIDACHAQGLHLQLHLSNLLVFF